MTVNAKKCLNWLAEKLNDNKFFLGHQSELDCTLYGYLSIILYHSLPNNSLQVHLQNCPNLVKYVENITKTYFAAEGCTSQNGGTKPKTDSKCVMSIVRNNQFRN
jgi:metaxin